jgi:hypothetical protein
MTIRNWETDPRAAEARRGFEAALRALARSHSADSLTVEAICARADRSHFAFFQVFESLEEAQDVARRSVSRRGP